MNVSVKALDDPRSIVDWTRVDNQKRISSIAAAIDRDEILDVISRIKPDLADEEMENTRRAYCSDVAHYLGWCVAKGLRLSSVTSEHMTDYVLVRPSAKAKQISRRSMNRRISAVKLLFEALIELDPSAFEKNPVRKRHFAKVSTRCPRPLPIRTLIAFIKAMNNVRDRTVFAFLLFTGCREDELSEVRIKDTILRKEKGKYLLEVRIRKGKGRKERTTYLGGLGLEVLHEYLHAEKEARRRKPTSEECLLSNHSGLPWTPRRIRKRFELWKRRLASTFNTTGWTTHKLRHTLLTEMADNDVSVFVMQKLSGHASVNTLQQYVEARDSKTRASYHMVIGKFHE